MTRTWTWRSRLPPPAPWDWIELIGDRSVREFAALHNLNETRVSEWKNGATIHWAIWELLLYREGKHPDQKREDRPTP